MWTPPLIHYTTAFQGQTIIEKTYVLHQKKALHR